ncbi:MAG: EFR1 family ferrodoxin [Spirochaetia bacterium]|jgi:ferredoxin|nr:EFR1 family ferrodoxin [Spirochaetia bacterium]
MGRLFWFSATGNSYKAAEKIAAVNSDFTLVKITDHLIASAEIIEDEDIGLVFPVFSWTLPEPVKEFIRKTEFKNVKYCFSVITMGASAGRAGDVLRKMLLKKGVELSFFRTVKMPDNCIYLYNPSASKGKEYIDSVLKEAAAKTETLAEKIKSRETSLVISKNILGWILTYGVGSLFKKQYPGFDKKFIVSDKCTGCGICRDVCSVSNIKIEDKRAVFSGNCILCMACINWCPEKAINYKKVTINRTRYHYPGLPFTALKDKHN